jgi:DNA-binding NtrC family response regulator
MVRPRSILLIANHQPDTQLIVSRATRAGWNAIVCHDLERTRAMLNADPDLAVSVVIIDEEVSGQGQYDAIAELKSWLPQVPVLLITSDSSPIPLYGLRAGATDFLTKPVAPGRLLKALRSVSRHTGSQEENLEPFAERIEGTNEFPSMIGTDPLFRAALAQAAINARGHGHILLEGESGTGKDMLARAIHAASPRSRMPIKAINVRGMADVSLESRLFGHVRGAFVGAFGAYQGLLQQYQGATLVLDEVNRLSPAMQERLATALASGRIRPMGASHSFPLDTRIIAISNQPLSEAVLNDGYSDELYSILSACHIALPPLRERVNDITLLAHHFLSMFRHSSGSQDLALTDEATAMLGRFQWPGNIRQLQAVLFRAAAFSSAPGLTIEDFAHMARLLPNDPPQECARESARPGGGVMIFGDDGQLRTLAEIENDIIRLAIGHYRGRMTEVARRLGIGRSTLYRKLEELGMAGKEN